MGWQRSRSLPGAGEARWACDAGAVRGRRSAPAGRHRAGRSACRVAARGLRPALAGRSSTDAATKRSAVRGLRSALAGRSAQRACSAGKALRCARVSFGVRFDAPILPFAMLMPRLPIFWALLQKNDPKFDVTPELLGCFPGTILCRIFPTWGNACAKGFFRCFHLQNRPEVQAAPLRSPGSPACFVIASAQALVAGEGALASFRPVGARATFSARAPRAGFFRPASPFLARLYPFESAVHRVVDFVRVRRSMPWLVHLARPPS